MRTSAEVGECVSEGPHRCVVHPSEHSQYPAARVIETSHAASPPRTLSLAHTDELAAFLGRHGRLHTLTLLDLALLSSTTCVIRDAHPYGLHDSVCRQPMQRMVRAAWSGGCSIHALLTARRQCDASSSAGSTTVSRHSILGLHSAAQRICRRPLPPRPPFVLPAGSLPIRVAGLRKPRTMRCHRIPDLPRCPSARASGT